MIPEDLDLRELAAELRTRLGPGEPVGYLRGKSQMRDVLVFTQEQKGPDAGSWDPKGPHAGSGGRLYMTSLAACTLEVYYRHLPIFRRIEFSDAR